MISFLLPSKNEPRAQDTALKVEEFCIKENLQCQIIVCNDREGKGKGWAVRECLKYATGDLICFLDGDGDIEPRMLKRLIPYLDDHDVVCGVKPISGLWSRRVLTYLSRIYLAILFNVKVDTQTGIKLFKRHVLDYTWYSNGWLFDVEILHNAKQRGCRMIEVPIECNVNKSVKGKALWRTLKESITLYLETR
jgi:glycosyltransferase involved in cell wall biosynthesis